MKEKKRKKEKKRGPEFLEHFFFMEWDGKC